ncbi:MAG: type III pantothenate kinase [Bdellovibrionaceae bacterium]|nr:type III pantothenate kinase [Pseudobdellovibrionaceae bacterium]MDW8191135.1 type III pantothenate kinase [Pseudobdellovibrionaceae bacterium]
MLLALDIGNSQIFGGVFQGDEIFLRFRKTSKTGASSDEIGLFLRMVLKENKVDPQKVTHIALCSVVPDVVHSIRNACRKYFDLTPFILQPGVKTGMKISYHNPTEVGADRIANAIGATHLYPNENLIIIDLGTATTFCAVSKDRDYLGGTIMPGLRISMEALETQTAKLPSVEIISPNQALGKSTVASIQSGLYYSHLGAMREIIKKLTEECFTQDTQPKIIGTGGFSSLFEKENIFDVMNSDLVLIGLKKAFEINKNY